MAPWLSILLSLCERNPPMTSGFPHKVFFYMESVCISRWLMDSPRKVLVIQSIYVFCIVILNKLLNKYTMRLMWRNYKVSFYFSFQSSSTLTGVLPISLTRWSSVGSSTSCQRPWPSSRIMTSWHQVEKLTSESLAGKWIVVEIFILATNQHRIHIHFWYVKYFIYLLKLLCEKEYAYLLLS